MKKYFKVSLGWSFLYKPEWDILADMALTAHIIDLLYKNISGQLSEAEEAELQAWALGHPSRAKLLQETTNELLLAKKIKRYLSLPDKEASDDTRLWAEIIASKKLSQRLKYQRGLIAAMVLMAVSFGIYLYVANSVRPSEGKQLQTMDIAPGDSKAVLTLSNGRQIDLSGQQRGIIVGKNNITYADGTNLDTRGGADMPSGYAILTTPKGGEYQVVLDDGTRVWLNAASTLRYPSHFANGKREVELEGEAYFEVKSTTGNPPFIVKSRNQVIHVLSTEFNVSAYSNEKAIKTTLIKGSVLVSHGLSGVSKPPSVILKPGYETVLLGSAMDVQKANLESVIAWKNGLFDFTNQTLVEVMNQLERWYDIEVIYENTPPERKFFGNIYRNKSLNKVLEILESAEIHFRLTPGRKLIITD